MSNKALRWAFELPITGAKKNVLIALADHADDAWQCYPSVPRLALFSGITDRAVSKCLRELEGVGLIRTVQITGQRSRYELVFGDVTPEPSSSPTPERGSSPAGPAPLNVVHHPPELRSPPPLNHVPKPLNHVHPNPKEPSVQPPVNPQANVLEQANTDRLLDLKPSDPQPKASRQPIADAIVSEFGEFWLLVPKKVDKAEAAKLFRQARTKKRVPLETITDAMRQYAMNFAPIGDNDPRWAVGPAKWLRGEKWNDQIANPAPAGRPPPRNGATMNVLQRRYAHLQNGDHE